MDGVVLLVGSSSVEAWLRGAIQLDLATSEVLACGCCVHGILREWDAAAGDGEGGRRWPGSGGCCTAACCGCTYVYGTSRPPHLDSTSSPHSTPSADGAFQPAAHGWPLASHPDHRDGGKRCPSLHSSTSPAQSTHADLVGADVWHVVLCNCPLQIVVLHHLVEERAALTGHAGKL
eukprot:363783-Chlamydomonas_euryale.AAC.9